LVILSGIQLADASRRRSSVITTTTTTTWQGGYLAFSLQIYSDEDCDDVYIPTAGAVEESSQWEWRRHWGDTPCWDMIDVTPPDAGLPPERESRKNYYFECANPEGVGNGLVHYVYSQQRDDCGGPRLHAMSESAVVQAELDMTRVHYHEPSESTETWGDPDPTEWRFSWPAMNVEALSAFLGGACTAWGPTVFAKFDRPVDYNYIPNCIDYACKDRACAGGRLSTDPVTGNTPYVGGIRTVTSKYGSASRAGEGLYADTVLRRLLLAVVILMTVCLLDLPGIQR